MLAVCGKAVRFLQARVEAMLGGQRGGTGGHREPVGSQLGRTNLDQQRLKGIGPVLEVAQPLEHQLSSWKCRNKTWVHVAIIEGYQVKQQPTGAWSADREAFSRYSSSQAVILCPRVAVTNPKTPSAIGRAIVSTTAPSAKPGAASPPPS